LLGACALVAWAPALAAQEDDPRKPPAIRTEGVPPVPPRLAEQLRRYRSVRHASFADWDPAGDGILVRTRFGETSQLHAVASPGARREQLTFHEEPVQGRWLPVRDRRLLVTSRDRGGDENSQIHLVDMATGEERLLTDGTSRNEMGPIHRAGRLLAIASNRRNGRDTDLWMVDPLEPGSERMILRTNGQYWWPHDWSRDGKRLLVEHYVSATESHPAVLTVEGDPGEASRLVPVPLPLPGRSAVGEMSFSPDGRSAYLTTDARGEFRELARVDLESGTYEFLSGDLRHDVDDVEVDPVSGRVAFAINDDGRSRLFVIDGDARLEIALPVGIATGLTFSPSGDRVGFTLGRPDAPADAYTASVRAEADASRQLTRWTFSETGGLPPDRFASPVSVRYPSFDGREIQAWIYRPQTATADAPAPVVIDIHGGPEGQYRPWFSVDAQFLVTELGFAVIAPNVRGSSGYGKTWLSLDDRMRREDSVKDIGALLDWIEERPDLDETRVAVTGGSYGGYMVLASLVHYPERIRAGVDVVGIASFITFLERTSPYRQDLRRAEYGDERDPEMRAFFEQASPLARVDRIRSALLVAHGVNDPRVPFHEAQQIAEAVRAAGRDVWTVYADNEGHGFGKRANRDYLETVTAMFLLEHLGSRGGASSAPDAGRAAEESAEAPPAREEGAR
jgi:dipeptidyl aminopeptidase/acylaminoacyl peptidase